MSKTETSSAPAKPHTRYFHVGDIADVFCDHKHQGERVRGWLQGVVVQADEKMAAVQFLDDVYLTDGWMVPDRVLWCRQGSDSIRPAGRRRLARSASKRA